MPKKKVLIFVVSYNAEAFIQKVLARIPDKVWENEKYTAEVLVIDDQSTDDTVPETLAYIQSHPQRKITLLSNPKNLGYGGNQKLGYHYALNNDFDIVVLLHGDGQYAPEYLDAMIKPILDDQADVVFGSRMIHKQDALKGGMPLYKWVGNQILTTIQNWLLGSHLAEFHTGYRAFRTQVFQKIRFEYNSNYYDFDTDIIIQLLDTGQRIKEIPIPTYYGDEISYVNGIRYGIKILATTFRSRIVKLHLLYDLRFDYSFNGSELYSLKIGYPSSHQFALDRLPEGTTILDIGSGAGYMTKALAAQKVNVISVDQQITPLTRQYSIATIEGNAETFDFSQLDHQINVILVLDTIEHLANPEEFLLKIRERFGNQENISIILTTGNIGFFLTRFNLLFGNFNYGKKGILDKDHKRLFTFQSMKRLLISSGYNIQEITGIPAPYPDAIGITWISRSLLAINQILIFFSKSLFSYQMALVATPLPTISHLLQRAKHTVTASQTGQKGV